jgi:hypothetical protein
MSFVPKPQHMPALWFLSLLPLSAASASPSLGRPFPPFHRAILASALFALAM